MNKEDATFRLSPEALDLIEEQAAHREISEDAVVEIAVRALVEYEKTLGASRRTSRRCGRSWRGERPATRSLTGR
jgi:hypothetical protein